MKVDFNTLLLVRALVKLTSAVTDIDELREHDRFKYQVKKDLNAWQMWVEEYTKDAMIKLTKADDTMLLDLIDMYDDFDKRFLMQDEYIAKMLLFLAKVNSALRDIEQMKTPYPEYVGILRQRISEILYKDYISIHIKNHSDGFIELLDVMNKLSDEEIVVSV
jgi:hypothetical protein